MIELDNSIPDDEHIVLEPSAAEQPVEQPAPELEADIAEPEAQADELPWYVYGMFPIDYGWEHLPTVRQTAEKLLAKDHWHCVEERRWVDNYDEVAFRSLGNVVSRFLRIFSEAMKVARQYGWEGDFAQGPKVFFLPDDTQFSYGFVWKESSNGSTYVVSPRKLEWLHPHCFDRNY